MGNVPKPSAELRTDPADGQQVTYDVLCQKYAGMYSKMQIDMYWKNDCKGSTSAAPKPAPAPQVVKSQAPAVEAPPATPEPAKEMKEETKDDEKKPQEIPWFAVPFALIGDRVKGVPLGMSFEEFHD